MKDDLFGRTSLLTSKWYTLHSEYKLFIVSFLMAEKANKKKKMMMKTKRKKKKMNRIGLILLSVPSEAQDIYIIANWIDTPWRQRDFKTCGSTCVTYCYYHFPYRRWWNSNRFRYASWCTVLLIINFVYNSRTSVNRNVSPEGTRRRAPECACARCIWFENIYSIVECRI